jgi:hypothetical protein
LLLRQPIPKATESSKSTGIATEVLLKASLEDWLSLQKDDFVNAADYVVAKNAELYRHLA